MSSAPSIFASLPEFYGIGKPVFEILKLGGLKRHNFKSTFSWAIYAMQYLTFLSACSVVKGCWLLARSFTLGTFPFACNGTFCSAFLLTEICPSEARGPSTTKPSNSAAFIVCLCSIEHTFST